MSSTSEADNGPDCWIRVDNAAKLIGPGGTTIRHLRQKYNCEISTARSQQIRDKLTGDYWQQVFVTFDYDEDEEQGLPKLITAIEGLLGDRNVTTVWPPITASLTERFEAYAKAEGYVSRHAHEDIVTKLGAHCEERIDTTTKFFTDEMKYLKTTHQTEKEKLQKQHALEVTRINTSHGKMIHGLQEQIKELQEEVEKLKQHQCPASETPQSDANVFQELLEAKIAVRKAQAELHSFKAQVEIEKADRDLYELRNGKRTRTSD
ncbi:hypothetical protein EX30DRAFT_139533 [Ascodesmis nigricans]|uniref:K Homology domain-containing protein n=1 Tax=Ascodesmis nigricans TaxID=341454 RepID=A0A4S2N103_9PEZI|nr:hypothetical protein EX30DRAFT_139533 [Ascodesmis nigricans]